MVSITNPFIKFVSIKKINNLKIKKMKIKNPTIQKTIKVATIAGAAVIVVNSAMKLVGISSPKDAVMPIVSILVGIAAFNYAMTAKADEIKVKG